MMRTAQKASVQGAVACMFIFKFKILRRVSRYFPFAIIASIFESSTCICV